MTAKIQHFWKPDEWAARLPEVLTSAARGEAFVCKVWLGDRPFCEIETKVTVFCTKENVGHRKDGQHEPLFQFIFDHRVGSDLWRVIEPVLRVLGPPRLLSPTTEVRHYPGSGDAFTPFSVLIGYWCVPVAVGTEGEAQP